MILLCDLRFCPSVAVFLPQAWVKLSPVVSSYPLHTSLGTVRGESAIPFSVSVAVLASRSFDEFRVMAERLLRGVPQSTSRAAKAHPQQTCQNGLEAAA